jgi:hypothetical protein
MERAPETRYHSAVASRLACLVLVLAGACRVSEDPPPSLPPLGDATTDAPERMVITDYPDGLSQPPFDSSARDAFVPPDASTLPDAPEGDDAIVGDAASVSCSLLAQDCVKTDESCYPGPTGAGECRRTGLLPEDTGCLEHIECRKGLVCVDAFGLGQGRNCRRLCDPTSLMSCQPGPACQAFPASSVGWCPP